MKTFRLLFMLFYLAIVVNILSAQMPSGMIAGTVTDDKGVPVVGAAILVKRQDSTGYNLIQITGNDGRFTAHVDAGVYVVKTEYRCRSSRVENIEVLAGETSSLDVKLADEDCGRKEAEEMAEWQVCREEMSVAKPQINDADKAEIINQILEELFKFDDFLIRDNYQEIIFSTENIDAAWIKPFPNIKMSFLGPQKLQVKADFSKEGRIGYYAFSDLWVGSSCAFIGISVQSAISKYKPKKKDEVVFSCPVGTSKGYLFRKESGKWKLRQFRE